MSPASPNSRRAKTWLLWLMVLLYLLAGTNHFLMPQFYVRMIPPGLPWPEVANWLSGAAEIVLAVALVPARTRRIAGWGVIALLVVVFPANVFMALEPERFAVSATASWLRLPLQAVLIAWAWWCTRPGSMDAGVA